MTVDVLRAACGASAGEMLAYAFFFATQVALPFSEPIPPPPTPPAFLRIDQGPAAAPERLRERLELGPEGGLAAGDRISTTVSRRDAAAAGAAGAAGGGAGAVLAAHPAGARGRRRERESGSGRAGAGARGVHAVGESGSGSENGSEGGIWRGARATV